MSWKLNHKAAAWDRIVAENNQPWEPLPGMVKRRCEVCDLWYAMPRTHSSEVCPDCAIWRRRLEG